MAESTEAVTSMTAEQFWKVISSLDEVDSKILAEIGMQIARGEAVNFEAKLVVAVPALQPLRDALNTFRFEHPNLFAVYAKHTLIELAGKPTV